jgi:prophage regulatory protein
LLRYSTTGLSRATLHRKIQNGTFPKQVRIAERCKGWRESAVSAWMQSPMFYIVDDRYCRALQDASAAFRIRQLQTYTHHERRRSQALAVIRQPAKAAASPLPSWRT